MTAPKMLCPDCGQPTLASGLSIELPPDSASDEITLHLIDCASCRFSGAAVYEESRRGRLDSEAWRHGGYRADEKTRARLRRAIEQCPAPRNRNCNCPSHLALGAQNAGGAWDGLHQAGVDIASRFAINESA